MKKLNDNIIIVDSERKKNTKASEEYIHVLFKYKNNTSWEGWIPVEYRRTGISIKPTEENEYLNKIYPQLNPSNYQNWLDKQKEYAASKGVEFVLTPIGYESFVFLLNKKNPVDSLTIDEVKGIYTGKYSNWKELGGKNKQIIPIQRAENSGSSVPRAINTR